MELQPGRVYLYRTPVDSNLVPFERYRDLAYQALGRLDVPLPTDGTIVFKPNITVAAEPDTRIITHPGFVLGLLQRFVERGVSPQRLVVVEGWGRPWGEGTHRPLHLRHRLLGHRHHHQHGDRPPRPSLPEVSGYDPALGELGLSLTNHDGVDGVDIQVPGAVVFEHLKFTDYATEAGLLVNVPVAKCHNLSCTTLCTKNLQGLVMSPQRHMCSIQAEDSCIPEADLARVNGAGCSHHEERFANKHADLVAGIRNMGVPRLCVIDGMVGRDGTAFNKGDNYPLGWTLIGDNETHVDSVGTYLFGLDPEKVPYLRVASDRGLGTNRIADIEVVDLASGNTLDSRALAAHRSDPVLMPLSRDGGDHYARFRQDGSFVPWILDRVNEQRRVDGLEPIPAT